MAAETQSLHYMEQFSDYSEFTSVQEMDELVKEAHYYYADELNETAKEVLNYIKTHACKVVGVAYLKASTIAAGIGKSERTVRFYTAKLALLGIITKEETTRTKKGGHGANAYVITRRGVDAKKNAYLASCRAETAGRDDRENVDGSKDESLKTKKETFNLLKPSIKINNIRKENDRFLDHKYVPSIVPKVFTEAVKPFFNNAKEIYRLWGKTRLAHQISGLNTPLEDLIDIAIKAFNESVFAYKQNRVKKAFTGYFFGTLRGMFAIEKRREVLNESERPTYLTYLDHYFEG
jgi:hypothetical protein